MKRSPPLHFRAAAMSSRPYSAAMSSRPYAAAMSSRPYAAGEFSQRPQHYSQRPQGTRRTYSDHNPSSSAADGENSQRPEHFVSGESQVNQSFCPRSYSNYQLYNPGPRQHFQNYQFYGPRQPINNLEYIPQLRPPGGSENNQNQFRPRQHFYNPTPRQQYQSNRSRNTGPLDFRKWEYAKPKPPTDFECFTILSYNILADYLATNHRWQLYYHIPRQFLDWQWRKRSIAFELGLWSADILCFQEVDKFEELEELLKPRGYTGIWKMRTGDPVDGCAIFWLTSRFKLLYEESIEFRKYSLRDNVAQICVMESTGCISNSYEPDSTTSQRHHNKIVVCNIHVLFNPKRGEIKLGQVWELLHRADVVSKLWDEAPVVLCGDFNSTPKSPLYNFIEEQKLDLSELPRDMVSGQASTPIAKQVASNHSRVQHFTGPAGDSLATSRNENADVVSPQVAENAGQVTYMMYKPQPPEVSFAGKNEGGDESLGETLIDKEQVLSDIKKEGSLCNSDVPGQMASVYLEGKSSYSTFQVPPLRNITEESNLENIPEATKCGSEETERIISVSSQVADKWQNLSPANLPQVSSSEKLDRSVPSVVLGGHRENGSLDGDYRLQDGTSNTHDFQEVQKGELDSSFEEPSVNGIRDGTPVENVEYNSSEKFMYDRSAWTPEEMKTATGNADSKVVEHPIKLKSTYTEVEDNSGTRDSSGEPLVTSYHRRFQGTVDYIWRSEGLQTVRVLAPIPKSAMAWTPGFPTKKWGSDHIALVSELAFVKGGSVQ